MLNPRTIILAVALASVAVGFAIPARFAALSNHGEPAVGVYLPTEAKPAKLLAPGQHSDPDVSRASAALDRPAGTPVLVAAGLAASDPKANTGPRELTTAPEHTTTPGSDGAQAQDLPGAESKHISPPLVLPKQKAVADPPAVAPAQLAVPEGDALPRVRDTPAQESSRPSTDAAQPPSSAPVEQTPLPTHSSQKHKTTALPVWLSQHEGEQDGQIASVVLQRARALYQEKVSEGQVKNSCYFAMDATRPNVLSDGGSGHRFYIICESIRVFRAISAGHGSGRKLKGIADFSDERSCAKNFSNALDSKLTAGGAYLTSETKTSFKGYYQLSAKTREPFSRTFVQYDGEGDTANTRERQIGGHAAELLKHVCRRKDPGSPYADHDGYVPFGTLVDYAKGRSDGCTSWAPSDAKKIISLVKDNPTTLYIYPEEADIDGVAGAVAAGRSLSGTSLYWNKACLKKIGSPKFWPRETLEPFLARYKKDHPASLTAAVPICKK
jgi:hypothetical protein